MNPTPLADRLRDHVRFLADGVGPRGLFAPDALAAAADGLATRLEGMGYPVRREAAHAAEGLSHNLVAERAGAGHNPDVWLVGAHYDTVPTTPGADDNASGVAVLLEIARAFGASAPWDTVRFVCFTNEEMPYFSTNSQGAMVHAKGCRARGERVRLMLSLEMLGFYSGAPDSQRYPLGVGLCRPRQGNFVAMVGSRRHGRVLRDLVAGFQAASDFPVQHLATPVWMPALVRSDHFAFWLNGYPAVMVTDTADFRNPHYHGPADTPDTLDYDAMARVTTGLAGALMRLAGVPLHPIATASASRRR
ncbi:MAG: M20/M25/M40 family metallo-hydrolase [Nitrospirae bacterium]|nr:M20/M25/M40 family metallo-hydrolase [Nitrospirota bacterium]